MKSFFLYFFIGCTLPACNNISQNMGSDLAVSTELLDTLTAPALRSTAVPLLFETAFIKWTAAKINESTVGLYGVNIGKLKLTTERLVACDPLHIDEYGIPFTQAFPTGQFPVQLAIAKLDLQEMIAFARIKFSEEPVVRWELALQKGQEPLPVGGKEIHGFSVDAGVVIFIDDAAVKGLDPSIVIETDGIIFKEMAKHYRNSWRFGLHNFGPYNLVAFTTGSGDGTYASYVGFDAKGNVAMLLTDFGLFEWQKK